MIQSLFDFTYELVREPAPVPLSPAGTIETEESDPFDWGDSGPIRRGNDDSALPSSDGLDAFREDQGKPEYEFVKNSAQFKRSVTALQKLHPGFYGKGERWKPGGQGQWVKVDLYGFADVSGIRSEDGRHVCAQVTSKPQVGDHIRKYLGDAKCDGNLVSYNLKQFLECRGIFIVLGYYKEPGCSAWLYTVTTVTIELLHQFESRKRKK